MRHICLIAAAMVLTGCSCGPAKWAEETENRLSCGLTADDVRSISGRDVQHLDVPRDWTTHLIRDGSTDLWLGFVDGKLRWSQILWAQKMMKMAMYSRRDLCGGNPSG
jgi:hypothetical protein